MAIQRDELVKYLNKLLDIYSFDDYGPNGLQVEGKEEVKKIAYAVSATRDSVEMAVSLGADALIVHHGLFWKFHGTRPLTGPFAKRIKPLIWNEINLLGYHLPLDAHIEFGNAASVAQLINLTELKPFGDHKGSPTGVQGVFAKPISVSHLKSLLTQKLEHEVIVSTFNDQAVVHSLGIITGGANGDWVEARRQGLDAYLTGEISEHDWHEAKEGGIHFFAGGHHATEQFGIQALLKHLHEKFKDSGVEHFYIPSSNPA